MSATRATGLWSGLMLTLVVAGSDSAAAGRPEEGALAAPLLLPPPELLVESGFGVELAMQVIWTDPDRIHVLGIAPRELHAIDPRTGLVDVIATEGPGPWDLQGPVALLSAGTATDELMVHLPGSQRSIAFSTLQPPRLIRHLTPITGSADGWWLGPVHRDPLSGAPARVELRAQPDGAPVWSEAHVGEPADLVVAQYFTRLLRGPGGRLWRVVLGMKGRADLIDPSTGDSMRLEVDPAEGAWIEASSDRDGTLHLLTSGGGGSVGSRILRFDPSPLPVLLGDRDWNTAAVSPDGRQWAALDAGDATLLLYDLAGLTTGPSNR